MRASDTSDGEGSGLLWSPRQLSDLPAVHHLQGSSRSLAQLGTQGTAEVIPLDVRQGIKADDNPVLQGWLPLGRRGEISSPPPEVRAGLQLQLSAAFSLVQPLPGFLDSSVLLSSRMLMGSKAMVPTEGLLSCLWATALVCLAALLHALPAIRDGPRSRLM